MNFQPTDYLANLNLVLEGSDVSPMEEPISNPDLDVFSQAEFFDFDVFSDDFSSGKDKLGPHVFRDSIKQELGNSVAGTPSVDMPGEDNLSEIKRKRNTAASARFRVKKKLKEKQMVQQTRQLEERLHALEKKLMTVEMENKCLKQLISARNEQKNCDLLDSIKKRSLGGSEGGLAPADASSLPFSFTN